MWWGWIQLLALPQPRKASRWDDIALGIKLLLGAPWNGARGLNGKHWLRTGARLLSIIVGWIHSGSNPTMARQCTWPACVVMRRAIAACKLSGPIIGVDMCTCL